MVQEGPLCACCVPHAHDVCVGSDRDDKCPQTPDSKEVDDNGCHRLLLDYDGDRVCTSANRPRHPDNNRFLKSRWCDNHLTGTVSDNCPTVWNPSQTSTAGGDTGDACTPDPDICPVCVVGCDGKVCLRV